ncbi:MAG: NifB/NifX family molybdenum-iron cluster-binding protein [Kiritimatiellae bacterium]|nr:NifB/NifX family molybdenum-iron cluster-binding protein [Kiritimatiellia bacterium]
MMRVAIPHWQGRVSPVFDVAGNLLLVDIADGNEQARRNLELTAEHPQVRAKALSDNGAGVLICGAISRPLEMMIRSAGIEVISQTCGDVEHVLSAFINGQLNETLFLMPGCRGRGLGFQHRRRGGRCRRGRTGGDYA